MLGLHVSTSDVCVDVTSGMAEWRKIQETYDATKQEHCWKQALCRIQTVCKETLVACDKPKALSMTMAIITAELGL